MGKIVRYCLEQDKDLQELTLKEFNGFTKLISADIFSILDSKQSVASRDLPGATSTQQVQAAIELAEQELGT